MVFSCYRRSVASIGFLVQFGITRGISENDLLQGSGVSPEQASDFNAEVSAAQELRVTNNLIARLGDPVKLGFEIGKAYHLSFYGLWGYGVLTSGTLGDALIFGLRFLPLTYAFTDVSIEDEVDHVALCFEAPNMRLDLTRFVLLRDMAGTMRICRDLMGDEFAVTGVALRMDPPGHRMETDITGFFGMRPLWAQRRNALVFGRADLTQSLPQANSMTASMCGRACEDLLSRRHAPLMTAEAVRQYLENRDGNRRDLGMIARLLNVSVRTLKRRLQDEGTSFRRLSQDVRKAMSRRLLLDERLSIAEIADRIGFSDPSSFSQAFKRWYGVAPSAIRMSAEDWS